MAGRNEETLEAQVGEADVDPWVEAFAALDKQDEVGAERAPDAGGDGEEPEPMGDTDEADGGEGAAQAEAGDGLGTEEMPGGPGDLGGTPDQEDEAFDWDSVDISEEGIKEYRDSLMEDIRERTITAVSQAYIKQGARNVNGKLGATINDQDICKRDRDGVPRFYNPETGREFTGDNPRRQAQEWVDDYNRELADAFNKTCADYSKRLLDQEGSKLAVIEFAPKYKSLDPVRRSMLDSILEDYEVTDPDGDVIGYSCDLDKALAAVDRQISVIKRKFSKGQQAPKREPSGPVLDTPNSGGGKPGGQGKPQFKSLAEAMEWEQDQIIEKNRKRK